ncbi:hypothetical protein O9993_03495 [Vibrio lentus]|nr:hypothetical protein [Vibrio lentus]
MARILKHGITEEASASNNAQVRQTVEHSFDIEKKVTVQFVAFREI